MIKTVPAKTLKALSTSNTVDFVDRPRGIIVTAGTIAFVNDDSSVTNIADGVLATGIVHPLCPKRINATGTTATIYGVY